MNEKSNTFLETEPIGALMRKYAVPCIISLLVAALYNIVDQIFIANASYLGSYEMCIRDSATAAPIIPHLKIKMKIGSRIILVTAPANVETMANFGLPSERIIGFMA